MPLLFRGGTSPLSESQTNTPNAANHRPTELFSFSRRIHKVITPKLFIKSVTTVLVQVFPFIPSDFANVCHLDFWSRGLRRGPTEVLFPTEVICDV